MVLPAPAPHDEVPPRDARWIEQFLALPNSPPLSNEQRAQARRLLAEAWSMQGRFHEAEALLASAVPQAEATLPPDHSERWRTLAAYGRVLFLQRHPEQAEATLRRALALAEKHAGKEHPDTGRILVDLARVEHHLGRPEAPGTATRALAIYEAAQIADTEKQLVRSDLARILPAS